MMARLLIASCLALTALTGCPDADNAAPEFLGMKPEVQAQAGETVSIIVSAEDPEGTTITLSMEQSPAGATFVVSGFGRFVWEPTPNDASPDGTSHTVVFKAVDADGMEATYRVVILVFASEGETRFITTNSRVLVLERDDALDAKVAVQADTQEEVVLELDSGPNGMNLSQDGPKSARISWQPTEDQIAKKLIWSAEVVSDPGAPSEARQVITITLVPKPCSDGNIELAHTPLAEQRDAGDYAVDVLVTGAADPDSTEVTLFWRAGGDPDDSGGFEGRPLSPVSDGVWRADIPNPSPPQGEPVDVFYFIVGAPVGEGTQPIGCLARSPEVGLHNFAAFAAGDDSCRVDKFEPNDTIVDAQTLTADAPGVSATEAKHWEVYGLQICEGDTDILALNLEAGKGVTVLNLFDVDTDGLTMRGIAPDGETVIIESSAFLAGETAFTLPASETGTHFIEISGAPTGYQLYMDFKDEVDPTCIDTVLEPNETADLSIIVPAGVYQNLRICPDDEDHFAVKVPGGYTLTVNITFSHDDGDLDLRITDNGTRVAGSFSETDNESATAANETSQERSYRIEVKDVGTAGGSNIPYTMIVTLEEGAATTCPPDFFEANDTLETAFPAEYHDYTSTTMCGDDDFFSLPGGSVGQKVVATVTADDGTDLDLDLDVFDPSGTSVATSQDAGPSESVTWSVASGGTHVVRVSRSGGNVATGGYTVNIAYEDDQAPCEVDANEENGVAAFAWPLDTAPQQTEIGLCPGDVDYFVVELQPNDWLLLDVVPSVIAGGDPYQDVSFEFIDNDGGAVLSASYLDSPYITGDYQTTTAVTVLIKVINSGTVGYRYDYDWVIL